MPTRTFAGYCGARLSTPSFPSTRAKWACGTFRTTCTTCWHSTRRPRGASSLICKQSGSRALEGKPSQKPKMPKPTPVRASLPAARRKLLSEDGYVQKIKIKITWPALQRKAGSYMLHRHGSKSGIKFGSHACFACGLLASDAVDGVGFTRGQASTKRGMQPRAPGSARTKSRAELSSDRAESCETQPQSQALNHQTPPERVV